MIKRILRIFGQWFVGVWLLAAVVFPFSGEHGWHGFAQVLIWVSFGIAALGAMLLMSAGGSGPSSASEIERAGALDPVALEEIQKDLRRGSTLGMELFYIGAGCAGLGYLLHRLTD